MTAKYLIQNLATLLKRKRVRKVENITDDLKNLYAAFGGDADNVETTSNITDILNAIATFFSGEGTATSISQAIQNITAVAANINPEITLEDKTITPSTSE